VTRKSSPTIADFCLLGGGHGSDSLSFLEQRRSLQLLEQASNTAWAAPVFHLPKETPKPCDDPGVSISSVERRLMDVLRVNYEFIAFVQFVQLRREGKGL